MKKYVRNVQNLSMYEVQICYSKFMSIETLYSLHNDINGVMDYGALSYPDSKPKPPHSLRQPSSNDLARE